MHEREFRHRPLTGKYPYLWLDALYEKVRIDGSVVSNAVVIAYGVSESGHRSVLAIDVVDTESKESWTSFLRDLRKRGLAGTKLVISDAHEGFRGAISAVMQGAAWQRCTVHFGCNVNGACSASCADRVFSFYGFGWLFRGRLETVFFSN